MKGIWDWLTKHVLVNICHESQEFGASIVFTAYGLELLVCVSSLTVDLWWNWKEPKD